MHANENSSRLKLQENSSSKEIPSLFTELIFVDGLSTLVTVSGETMSVSLKHFVLKQLLPLDDDVLPHDVVQDVLDACQVVLNVCSGPNSISTNAGHLHLPGF